jgi:hypothetical protein
MMTILFVIVFLTASLYVVGKKDLAEHPIIQSDGHGGVVQKGLVEWLKLEAIYLFVLYPMGSISDFWDDLEEKEKASYGWWRIRKMWPDDPPELYRPRKYLHGNEVPSLGTTILILLMILVLGSLSGIWNLLRGIGKEKT